MITKSQLGKVDQGEILRWLGEAPWYPTVLWPLEWLKWKSINGISAKAILSGEGVTLDGVFHFNEKGQIIRFTAKRYKEDALENWTG